MILVVDASVAIKWFFQNRDNETDCDLALTILESVDTGQIQLLQPPHFIAEVAAVLACAKPGDVGAMRRLRKTSLYPAFLRPSQLSPLPTSLDP